MTTKYPLFTVEHHQQYQHGHHNLVIFIITICFLYQQNFVVECLPSSTSSLQQSQPQISSSSSSSSKTGIESESTIMDQHSKSSSSSLSHEIPHLSNRNIYNKNDDDDDDDDGYDTINDYKNGNDNNMVRNKQQDESIDGSKYGQKSNVLFFRGYNDDHDDVIIDNVNNINHHFPMNSLLSNKHVAADINDLKKNLIAMNNNNNNNHLNLEDQRPKSTLLDQQQWQMFRIPMKSQQSLYGHPIQTDRQSIQNHLSFIYDDDDDDVNYKNIANREFFQQQQPLHLKNIASNAIHNNNNNHHHHHHPHHQQHSLLSSSVGVPVKRRTSAQGFLRFGRLSWPLKQTILNGMINNNNGGSKRGEETAFLRFGRTPESISESMLPSFTSPPYIF
ncbi:hypothetical protein DERF_014706 [Dermatophagoides farinae]|uniref:Uncharacterized protein n=1 Tax=Dermatophagoides farinae TaxID=6954 RepID=A0A922HMQ3_DERFA|nr:hypothetical protein DERF_014706 [Dermatophagoides farinae]